MVDLIFDGQPVAIPPESAFDVMSALRLVACDGVLDGTHQDVAVVGQTRSEWRAIVEGVLGQVLGPLQLLLEGVNVLPVSQNLLLFTGKVWVVWH